MPVGELLRRVDSRELSEWMAWERANGTLGASRLDFLLANVAATMASTVTRKPVKIAEYLVFELAAMSRGWHGGRQTLSTPEAFIEWARAMKAQQDAMKKG